MTHDVALRSYAIRLDHFVAGHLEHFAFVNRLGREDASFGRTGALAGHASSYQAADRQSGDRIARGAVGVYRLTIETLKPFCRRMTDRQNRFTRWGLLSDMSHRVVAPVCQSRPQSPILLLSLLTLLQNSRTIVVPTAHIQVSPSLRAHRSLQAGTLDGVA